MSLVVRGNRNGKLFVAQAVNRMMSTPLSVSFPNAGRIRSVPLLRDNPLAVRVQVRRAVAKAPSSELTLNRAPPAIPLLSLPEVMLQPKQRVPLLIAIVIVTFGMFRARRTGWTVVLIEVLTRRLA